MQPPDKRPETGKWSLKRIGEFLAISLMLLGAAMVCQPFFHFLFRWGFLVTLGGIVLFPVATNLPARGGSEGRDDG
jgi:hypothetical protein